MGWLGWTLIFGVLALLALGLLGLLGLRLWRGVKALGRDVERASRQLAAVGSVRDQSGRN
jgi:hypothetical protein